jgi:hypothetical protein
MKVAMSGREQRSRGCGGEEVFGRETGWHFQAVLQHEGFVGENAPDGTVSAEMPFVQEQDAVAGSPDEFEVMAGDDAGDGQAVEDSGELASSARIQVAGGFVHEDDDGVQGHDTRDGDSAFFAGGEVERDTVPGILVETDAGESGFGATVDFIEWETEVEGAEGDVVIDAGIDDLVVGVLEDETEFLMDGATALFGGEVTAGDGD